MLRDKDRLVLGLVVESYLGGGRPVSSGLIARTRSLDVSPATIRGIMARLEKQGFLHQPHTSAGRVPTDKGLRHYVNSLLEETLYADGQAALQPEDIAAEPGDLGGLLEKASRILAEQSDSLAFVVPPQISRIRFRHLRFLKLSRRQVMVILVSTFNMVVSEIVETETPLTQDELDSASQYINQNFRGQSLVFVRDNLVQEIPKLRSHYEDLIGKLLALVKASIVREEEESHIHLQGQSRLLGRTGPIDVEDLRSLFRSFEEKSNLARLLSDFITLDRVKVLIGPEANLGNVSDCSLVLSHYGSRDQVLGSLGVIGPRRIPYDRIIPLVDRVAQRLSKALGAGWNEVKLS